MSKSSAPTPPATRTTRGLALYRDYAGEIVRTGPHTYEVPSCTGSARYEDGVLEVTVQGAAVAREPKHIQIEGPSVGSSS